MGRIAFLSLSADLIVFALLANEQQRIKTCLDPNKHKNHHPKIGIQHIFSNLCFCLFVSLSQVSLCQRDRVFITEEQHCAALLGADHHCPTGAVTHSVQTWISAVVSTAKSWNVFVNGAGRVGSTCLNHELTQPHWFHSAAHSSDGECTTGPSFPVLLLLAPLC